MKKKQLIQLAFVFLFAFTACNDKDKIDDANLNGTYTGTFTVEYSNGNSYSNSVTVTLNQNQYTCSSGENRKPAGGSGGYYLEGAKIVFLDENLWTADFDWNLILSGAYDLKLNDKSIEISAMKNGVGFYQYKLHKTAQ
jgi:hypothetical protein